MIRAVKISVSRYVAVSLVFCVALLFPGTCANGAELLSQAQLILKSPDVSVSVTYDLPGRPTILESLLQAPILLWRLWEAYDGRPQYKIRLQGDAIHVDDPTGIQGDVYLVAKSPNSRIYYGVGALNHSLVPAFQGRMALVLTTTPKGSGINARIDVSIRTESRILGFFARTLFPLVRPRIENRMKVTADYMTQILDGLSNTQKAALSRLKKEDAAAVSKILPPPPPTKGPSKSK